MRIKILSVAAFFVILCNIVYPQINDSCFAGSNNDIPGDDYLEKSFKSLKIDDKRIVMLGEQAHGDEATFKVKAQMINYLVKNKGFNIIAFESGYYDMLFLDSLIKRNQIDDSAIRGNLQKWWSASPVLLKMFTDLQNLKNNGYDISLRGIDCQFTGNYSVNFLMNNIYEVLDKVDTTLISPYEISQIIKQTKKFVSDFGYRIENPILRETLGNIKNKLLQIADNNNFNIKPFVNSFDFYVRRGTDFINKREDHRKNERLGKELFGDNNTGYFIRDSLMALNVIELLKDPKNKIIIWAHNAHIIYNTNKLDFNEKLKITGKFLGQHLFEHFPNNCMNVGFTSYTGNTIEFEVTEFNMIHSCKTLSDYSIPKYYSIPSSDNSLEKYFSTKGSKYCFLNTKCLTEKTVIFKPFRYAECTGDLSKSYDALFFIREMVNSNEYFKRFSSTKF